MLNLTRVLKKLRVFKGFDKLIGGFRNPTQLLATIFEIQVADWCLQRAVTHSLEFSPDVSVKGGVKRPELLWETTLGKLYVECKRSHEYEADFTKRLSKLGDLCDKEYGRYGSWSAAKRPDIVIDGVARNGIEQRLCEVIERAATAQLTEAPEARFSEGEVSVILRPRDEPPPTLEGGMRTGRFVVGTEPTQLDEKSAVFTLTMSLKAHRVRAAGKLLREARTQLPSNGASAVFIDVGTPEACQAKVKSLLEQPSYANTPFVAIWSPPTLYAAWRENQPFDNRLLQANVNSEQSPVPCS